MLELDIRLTHKAFDSSIILITVLARCSFPPSVGTVELWRQCAMSTSILDAPDHPHCSWPHGLVGHGLMTHPEARVASYFVSDEPDAFGSTVRHSVHFFYI